MGVRSPPFTPCSFLFALLLGIIPVTADVPSIVNFFGSYYLATLVMLRTVSRGTRNAFWSDVYETAGSVALSWTVLLAGDKVVRPDTPVVVAFRPEHIALAPSNAAANATVEEVLYLGNVVKVIGSVAGTQVKATMPAHGYIPNAGDRVVLSVDADSGVVFFR
jgi:hypothetical protein